MIFGKYHCYAILRVPENSNSFFLYRGYRLFSCSYLPAEREFEGQSSGEDLRMFMFPGFTDMDTVPVSPLVTFIFAA
jgi:hypothetical protein